MLRTSIFLLIILLLTTCELAQEPTPAIKTGMPAVKQSRELVVVTYNSPTTYFINGSNNPAGMEYQLAQMFAKELGTDIKLKFLLVDGIKDVIPAIVQGRAHIAAAGIGITPRREKQVKFGPTYQKVKPQVVVNRNQKNKPKNINDLSGMMLKVPYESSYNEQLTAISQQIPDLKWSAVKTAGMDELLEKVAEGSLEVTIADSHLVNIVKNYYPNLKTVFNFESNKELAWVFPKDGDQWLYQKALVFFERIKRDRTLSNLIDRYYAHAERLNAIDVSHFLIKTRTLLPKYLDLFKQAQEITDIDWRLLAAISYQESHWDTFSTSPTKVRGLMMLTEDTADMMGVTDRLDPNQSIPAGARYLLRLKQRIPDRIPEPDRTWLALAAYNIGMAHVEDARILAQQRKLNPDVWADVKKTLPLLNKAEYYSKTKYGFARGSGAVIYVESIRTYYKIMEKYQERHDPESQQFNLAYENSVLPSCFSSVMLL